MPIGVYPLFEPDPRFDKNKDPQKTAELINEFNANPEYFDDLRQAVSQNADVSNTYAYQNLFSGSVRVEQQDQPVLYSTKKPLPMVDYDMMLTADFHPFFKNLRLPPLYITNCESRSLSISQQVPSIKTWGGVHFDDWGEGEITLDVQGIVAPFRGHYNKLPDDWKSQYSGDPVFNDPQSMYYLAFQDNRLGVTVKDTLGYKHFEQLLNFWRSNATLYSKKLNVPVVQGNIVAYTEFSCTEFTLPETGQSVGAAALSNGPNPAPNTDLDMYHYNHAGFSATPGEIYTGKMSSFSWEESQPYYWTVSFQLTITHHFMNVAPSFGSRVGSQEVAQPSSPPEEYEVTPMTRPWTVER